MEFRASRQMNIMMNKNAEVAVVDIFNFSTKPLPDLSLLRSNLLSVKEIYYFKEVGFKRTQMPSSLSDEVALIICVSSDKGILDKEIEMIAKMDESGDFLLN